MQFQHDIFIMGKMFLFLIMNKFYKDNTILLYNTILIIKKSCFYGMISIIKSKILKYFFIIL